MVIVVTEELWQWLPKQWLWEWRARDTQLKIERAAGGNNSPAREECVPGGQDRDNCDG